MSEEIFLEGKTYVSSKRAAEQTGYAQDYIGQLARKGIIDAQRVGGLWYVRMDSLADYQRNSASYTPTAPVKVQKEVDSVITFDGKDFISASRAAKLTGYNQDYIGQLARGGKILSRQIGNRWYVDRQMLLAHKMQKDALLAAVQAESLGISRPVVASEPVQATSSDEEPLLTYLNEDGRDLMPTVAPQPASHEVDREALRDPAPAPVPIRRISTVPTANAPSSVIARQNRKPKRTVAARKTMIRATELGVALTFVIVLSYGFSTLKSGSVYTANVNRAGQLVTQNAYTASAMEAAQSMLSRLESWITPELQYARKP